MKVRLVFHDWIDKNQNPVYDTEEGIELTMGSFHHGTVFEGDLELDEDRAQDLKKAMEKGYIPVFYVPIVAWPLDE